MHCYLWTRKFIARKKDNLLEFSVPKCTINSPNAVVYNNETHQDWWADEFMLCSILKTIWCPVWEINSNAHHERMHWLFCTHFTTAKKLAIKTSIISCFFQQLSENCVSVLFPLSCVFFSFVAPFSFAIRHTIEFPSTDVVIDTQIDYALHLYFRSDLPCGSVLYLFVVAIADNAAQRWRKKNGFAKERSQKIDKWFYRASRHDFTLTHFVSFVSIETVYFIWRWNMSMNQVTGRNWILHRMHFVCYSIPLVVACQAGR